MQLATFRDIVDSGLPRDTLPSLRAGSWVDVARERIPLDQKVYTWWSYRAADWTVGDRGRRLDHIWVTQKLSSRLGGHDILRHVRGWDRPSDHVPVILDMKEGA